MWPSMDPILENSDITDMPPLMLQFSLDGDTASMNMFDSIAKAIKVEAPDPSELMSTCSSGQANANQMTEDVKPSQVQSLANFTSVPSSSSMSTAQTFSTAPTLVTVGPVPKLPTVHSSTNGTKSPQCKVCNDESSGFHYGVDSCEGCKGFFRRCITQGMTHKCSNNEKCEITPFTRNSCQYCRLKKCFAVGMSREASRLGRRPKKLKDPNSDSSRSHAGNLPIAPYPSPGELHNMRMAELQRMLQANGTFKSELMQAFLSAQTALREQFGQTTASSASETKPVMTVSQMAATPVSTVTTFANLSTPPDNTAGSASTAGMASGGNVNAAPTPMNCDSINPNIQHVVRTLESGYSSLSSPSSSKSQSPIQYSNPSTTGLGGLSQSQTAGLSQTTAAGTGLTMGTGPNLGTGTVASLSAAGVFSEASGLNMGSSGSSLDNNNLSPMLPPHMEQMLDTNIANVFGQSGFGSTGDMMSMVYSAMENAGPQHSMPIGAMLPQSPPNQPSTPSAPYNCMDLTASAETEMVLTFVKQVPSDLRKKLIDQVTDTIVDAHMVTCRVLHKNVDIAFKKAPRLTGEQGPKVLEENALAMWRQFVKNMVPEITAVVKFCKRLPGFTEIEQDDQIRLIKQGSFECLICRFSLLVDTIKHEMLDPDMEILCTRDVVRGMPMGTFFEEFFVLADLLNPLKLLDSEIGLFIAILAMCPDRKDLEERRTITKIQALFYQALYYLVQKNHPDSETIFVNLLNTIPVLREINEQHCMALNNIKMKSPDKVEEFPALHKEVYFLMG